ncbi:MAG: SMP-30/gluconolactonase/LRE family protein [Aeoliella sp.]
MKTTLARARPASILAALIATLSPASAQTDDYAPHDVASQHVGRIERLDPALDALVPRDARIEVLADGFDWAEGPVWISAGNYLLFSDIPPNTIYRWKSGAGLSVYLKPSGYTGAAPRGGESGSNGLAIDREGRLLLCQHGDRRVARMDAPLDKPQPKFVTLVDNFQGKRFNSPNDLAVHSSGSVFFTDPPYGLVQQLEDPARELDFQGVYRVDSDGELTLLTDDLPRPNGIAFSPDEKTLYVAQSHEPARIYMAYDVDENLDLSGGRVFFDAGKLGETREGSPDGIKIDQQGNLFATGPGGVLVLSPEGKHLGTIMTGQRVANCAFGDDGQTLYLTADRYLCRVRLSTKGIGF